MHRDIATVMQILQSGENVLEIDSSFIPKANRIEPHFAPGPSLRFDRALWIETVILHVNVEQIRLQLANRVAIVVLPGQHPIGRLVNDPEILSFDFLQHT